MAVDIRIYRVGVYAGQLVIKSAAMDTISDPSIDWQSISLLMLECVVDLQVTCTCVFVCGELRIWRREEGSGREGERVTAQACS